MEYQRTAYQAIINDTNGYPAEFADIRLQAFLYLAYTYPQTGRKLLQALCSVPALAPEQAGKYPVAFALRASIENNLARIYLNKNIRPIAELHFRQSLYLLRMVATYHPDWYIDKYMLAAEILANLYLQWFEYRKATSVFREMKTMARYVTDNAKRNEYLDTAINGLNTTGTAFNNSYMHNEALELYLEAMNDFWQLSEAIPAHLNDVAMLQSNIGNHYAMNGEYGKACEILDKALGTYRYIRKKETGGYNSDREADVYLNIGYANMCPENFRIAAEMLRKSCRMYRNTLKTAPSDDIRARYATALSNLGNINLHPWWPFPALPATFKSLNIRRRLVKKYPDKAELRCDLSDCYYNLGKKFYKFMPSLSVRILKKAVRLRESLAETEPGRYLQPLANTYRYITIIIRPSRFISHQKLYTEKLHYCRQSLSAYAKLQQSGFLHEIAAMNADAGECCLTLRMLDEAYNHLIEAMMMYDDIEPKLDINGWCRMLTNMVYLTIYLICKKDKHNAVIIVEKLNQKFCEAPETLARDNELIRQYKRLTETVAKME